MSVRGSTKLERVRAADGAVTALPGGMDGTGLGALASVGGADGSDPSSPAALSGAGRAAVYMDPVTPHVEARLLVQSTRDEPLSYVSAEQASGSPWATVMRPRPGAAPWPGYVAGFQRPDNATFCAFRLDSDVLDDPARTLAPVELEAGAELAPWVFQAPSLVARPVANPEADASGAAWLSVAAPTDENIVPNPSFTTNAALWRLNIGPSGTRDLSRVTSGGEDGGAFGRVTVTAPVWRTYVGVTTPELGPVAPGQSVSTRLAVSGTPGEVASVTLWKYRTLPDGSRPGTPMATSTVTLTAAWQVVTLPTASIPAGDPTHTVALSVGLTGATDAPVGTTLSVDRVKVRRATTVGSYVDGASTSGRWLSTAHGSPSVIAATSGTYSRTADATAPSLGLPGTSVHRRTGTLAAGARLWSPAVPVMYGLDARRSFTVAGWVKVTSAGSGLVTLRWVVEVQWSGDYLGTVHVMRSAPFAVRPGASYVRCVREVAAMAPFSSPSADSNPRQMRVALEVVAGPTSGDTSASTLSVRGAHAYAGTDRGDVAGLRAAALGAFMEASVGTGSLGRQFRINRIDVHGHDGVSHVTSASVHVRYQTEDGSLESWGASGASPGRLTVRIPDVPDGYVAAGADVYLEEVDSGPGGDVSVQNIVGWHEVDATGDVVSMSVERSADADPGNSTVPVGNYAAASCRLELDDPTGAYSLFRRSYLTLRQRVELAAGFAYTNRVQDPAGVDAYGTAAATVTYPAGPVAPVTADVYGQVPPCEYVAAAAGASGVAHAAAPVGDGWSVRGAVWVRRTGPGTLTLQWGGGRVQQDAAGVTAVGATSRVLVPQSLTGGTWWLVPLAALTIPAGETHALISATMSGGDATTRVELAAPIVERLIGTDVVEVVEMAPAGVFYVTSWGDDASTSAVSLSGVDILGATADDELAESVRVDTTSTVELHRAARRSLDLGIDQVRIETTGTQLPFMVPAATIGEQMADLGKAASVTIMTDGTGRLVAELRQQTPAADDVTEYPAGRSLVQASTALTYDAVRNDATVTVHPARRGPGGEELAVAGRQDPITLPFAWAPTLDDIPVYPGTSVTLELRHDPAVDQTWDVAWLDGTIPEGSVIYSDPWGLDTWPGGPSQYSITHYGDRTVITLALSEVYASPVWVLRAWGVGVKVITSDVSVTKTADASITRFGRRSVGVDVRLAQAVSVADDVATDILRTFSLIDEDGGRWLPDLDAEVLMDPWREVGDRVIVQSPDGPAGEYRVVRHVLDVGIGGSSGMYLRQIAQGLQLFTLDASTLDGTHVLAY